MVVSIDASVRRVKSAVVNRMEAHCRKDNGQYMGWLLKARLQPLMITQKSLTPTVNECRGIVGCCHTPKQPKYSKRINTTPNLTPRQEKKTDSTPLQPSVNSSVDVRRKKVDSKESTIRSADDILDNIYKKPYRRETTMNYENSLSPIRKITVGKSSSAVLETKYKCLSAQFCGHYQVPGSNSTSPSQQNVLIPRYGMFNAEECYVYEHDAKVQNSKSPVVIPSKSVDASSFNVELDFMLDKFDSDNDDHLEKTQNDIQRIASKYRTGGNKSGLLDWEDMVTNTADGALDMSGSQRQRRSKKSTKLRSPTVFTEGKRRDTRMRSCGVKPGDLDEEQGSQSDEEEPDVTWYDVNSLRLRNG